MKRVKYVFGKLECDSQATSFTWNISIIYIYIFKYELHLEFEKTCKYEINLNISKWNIICDSFFHFWMQFSGYFPAVSGIMYIYNQDPSQTSLPDLGAIKYAYICMSIMFNLKILKFIWYLHVVLLPNVVHYHIYIFIWTTFESKKT